MTATPDDSAFNAVELLMPTVLAKKKCHAGEGARTCRMLMRSENGLYSCGQISGIKEPPAGREFPGIVAEARGLPCKAPLDDVSESAPPPELQGPPAAGKVALATLSDLAGCRVLADRALQSSSATEQALGGLVRELLLELQALDKVLGLRRKP